MILFLFSHFLSLSSSSSHPSLFDAIISIASHCPSHKRTLFFLIVIFTLIFFLSLPMVTDNGTGELGTNAADCQTAVVVVTARQERSGAQGT